MGIRAGAGERQAQDGVDEDPVCSVEVSPEAANDDGFIEFDVIFTDADLAEMIREHEESKGRKGPKHR